MLTVKFAVVMLLGMTSLQLPAQSSVHYFPMNPGGIAQVGKWTVANSGGNFIITAPDATTSTVAKAGAFTQSVSLFTPPAKFKILDCTIKTGTAFTGTATLTATVGITGSPTGCITGAFNLQTTVSNTQFAVGLPATPVVSFNGTDAFILALTSTVNNISAVSAGSVDVWITYVVLP